MFIESDFSLRYMEEKDLELVLNWRNSKRVRAVMYTDEVIIFSQHKAWFERVKKDESKIFLIFEWKGKPFGVVNFIDIDHHNGRCVFGMYLGEEAALPGIGAVMEYKLLEYAFETIKIRKLCGEVFAFNTIVTDLHERFGFKKEGLLVEHVCKNGKYEDIVCMAMFADTWQQKKELLKKLCFPTRRRNKSR